MQKLELAIKFIVMLSVVACFYYAVSWVLKAQDPNLTPSQQSKYLCFGALAFFAPSIPYFILKKLGMTQNTPPKAVEESEE